MNSQSYVPDRSWSASGHSDFIRELNQAIRQNPVPAALIGAGIAWLFMGGRHTVLGGASRSAFRGLGHGAQQAGGAAYQGAKSVGELASAGVNLLAEGATQAGSRAANAARTATDAIGDTIQQTAAATADVASSAAGRISHIGEMVQSTQSNIRLSRPRAPFQRHVIGSLRETASPGGSHWTGNRGRHRSLNAR